MFLDLFKKIKDAKDSAIIDDLMSLSFYCSTQKKENSKYALLLKHSDYIYEKSKLNFFFLNISRI